MAILYPIALANLVVEVGTRHCHQILFLFIHVLMSVVHYNDVIMGAMASQITNPTSVYSTVYSRRRSKWPVNSPHKRPVTQKMSPFDDVIMSPNPTSMYQTVDYYGIEKLIASKAPSLGFSCFNLKKKEWQRISLSRFTTDWHIPGIKILTLRDLDIEDYKCAIKNNPASLNEMFNVKISILFINDFGVQWPWVNSAHLGVISFKS